jgi:hypothetical protein
MLVLCAIGSYLALSWSHLANKGSEVSPSRYSSMRDRWASDGPDHYRMVARYYYQVGGCSEDVEVRNERVIKVYETDCSQAELFTVSDLFDIFDDYIGHGSKRPEASDGCSYYYVNGVFDIKTGYPRFLENHLVGVPSRGFYAAFPLLPREYACLAIGPPHYTSVIEFLTPLE